MPDESDNTTPTVSPPSLPELVAARASLSYIRKDLNQIFNMGQSGKDNGNDEHISLFKAMYHTAADLRNNYLTEFKAAQGLAITKGAVHLFPLDDDIKRRTEINTQYFLIVKIYQELDEKPNINPNTGSCCNVSLSQNRLPRIDLPKFSGNITEWPKYKRLFFSIIDASDMPVIEKFHHLTTSLSGEPLTLISALTINEENYPKALASLKKRYDNNRLLATSYIEKVLDFNPGKGPATFQNLQLFSQVIFENIAAMKSIQLRDEADLLWLTLSLRKLDPQTRKRFEESVVGEEWPSFQQLVKFIQDRCHALQLSESCGQKSWDKGKETSGKTRVFTVSSDPVPSNSGSHSRPASQSKTLCDCTRNHPLFECPLFRTMTPARRRSFLSSRKVCFNCLRAGHLSSSCQSNGRCRVCSRQHHTMVHDAMAKPGYLKKVNQDSSPQGFGTESAQNPSKEGLLCNSNSVVASVTGPTQVLLGTALVLAYDVWGRPQTIRILVDCGSQLSLISTHCAKRLGIPWRATSHRPLGAGQVLLPDVKGRLSCELHSRIYRDKSVSVEPLVVTRISGILPSSPLSIQLEQMIDQSTLADPEFWKPAPIDFLLGNDIFMSIITGPVDKLKNGLGAFHTIFGQILMGICNSVDQGFQATCLNLMETPPLNDLLTRFWELEHVNTPELEQPNDECENHFARTHYRQEDGRYVVALPLKEGFQDAITSLSESRDLSLNRFRKLEEKLKRNRALKEKYCEFMSDYERQGHMSMLDCPPTYVIPHHAVFKQGDTGGKIRVVFDASMKTSGGSLNDWLMIGPKLQNDISAVILRFRLKAIAITTDLVGMYRQILVAPEHRTFQCIWWRSDSNMPYNLFSLNTVTFGEGCSPYLALRTLRQLIKDEGAPYPLASEALQNDIYVDDIVSGANSLGEAIRLYEELVHLLKQGQFTTHKWKTNSPELMEYLCKREMCSDTPLGMSDRSITKILGMLWDPKEDCFHFETGSIDSSITKRKILSTVARIYDPMGFLGPMTLFAKALLQKLWVAKLGWDDRPNDKICEIWSCFVQTLPKLRNIKIPRPCLGSSHKKCQLIGFSDASQTGYAAVVYLRAVSCEGTVTISLLKSKTRVSPLKTISIPRLELCGAHLLTKLIETVLPSLENIHLADTYLFTDSMVVLSWLRISPHCLQTFVANRVSQIVSSTSPDQWRHVSSDQNPADCASRGLQPHQLVEDPLWWAGPPWLYQEPVIHDAPIPAVDNVPELRTSVVLTMALEEPWVLTWMVKFSKFSLMVRSLAQVIRYFKNKSFFKDRSPLTLAEIDNSLKFCVKAVQEYEFSKEFDWKGNKPMSRRLLELSVRLDEEGLLRVGGRLQHAFLPMDCKSPLILPGKTHLTTLLIDHFHLTHFHLGATALQALLKRRFWIFQLRQAVRGRIKKCTRCIRWGASSSNPLMGALPVPRVRQGRPFLNLGVDYAGPFPIKLHSRRNAPQSKAYLCIFVCMVTKAVHLECVSSLSTDAFLAALDRLVARRGIPFDIWSDCGRNFVGAANRLKEFFSWLADDDIQSAIANHTVKCGFQWHFNPPYSPHFGGLWEAAVKSVKYHLHRVVGEQALTFEELSTFFVRIEAVLNSRPIGSKGEDPSNLDPLTPGHFIIGEPLISIPEPNLTDLKQNTLSRWQLVQCAVQHFWKRWHKEYLNTLQKRTKWYHQAQTINIGDMVLVPDDTTSRGKWPLAKVIAIHPGVDGVTRVVTLKGRNSVFRRAVHKLIPLSQLSPDKE